MSLNDAFDALLGLAQGIEPAEPGSQWAEIGRKMRDPSACQKPALFQVEGDCEIQSRAGQLQRWKEQVLWVIVLNSGADQAVEPARQSQDLKGKIRALFGDNGISFASDQLGGRVYSAYLDGAIRRYAGDLDGIEMLAIPIILFLP